ncbi:organic cation transporter protein-like [Saccoglossus kowalevskii]|uniref:Organic cation transporter protein-like n=1 Tax=Saccoglossus kowalevskii TaxID=10224 RepID=A0ABM0M8N9_SACKO|nr:PREDICTED: organic cation transporter protein-like [Saccoglossus kowalevskii]
MTQFEDILKSVGSFGRSQQIQYICIFIAAGATAFYQMGNTFYSASADHYCRTYKNQTYETNSKLKNCTIPYSYSESEWEQCERYDVNVSQEVSVETCFPRSGTTDCDGEWVYDDYCYGRKIVFAICLLSTIVVAIAAAFSPTYYFFLVCQFLLGAFPHSLFVTGNVMVMEMIGVKYRTILSSLTHVSFSLFYMLFGIIAYAWYGSWRPLQLTAGLIWILFIPSIWLVTESAMWLIQKTEYAKATKVLNKWAKMNKTEVPDNLFKEEMEMAEKKKDGGEIENKPQKYTVVDIFKTPNLRFSAVLMCFNWFSCSFVYYGISLNTDQIGENPYITFFIAAAVEVPGRFLGWWLMRTVGRRWALCSTAAVGGLCLIISVPPENTNVSVTLAMIAKLCIAGTFVIVYVYGLELYPTTVRNAGMGVSSMCARVGSIISPYVFLLADIWEPAPYIIMGATSVVAGFLALLIPETRNQRLPETIEDGRTFGKKSYKRENSEKAKESARSISVQVDIDVAGDVLNSVDGVGKDVHPTVNGHLNRAYEKQS